MTRQPSGDANLTNRRNSQQINVRVASILTKSKNPNLTDGHTDKVAGTNICCNKLETKRQKLEMLRKKMLQVFCIVNHPNNPQEFLSGGWDGAIHVWDARFYLFLSIFSVLSV